MDTSPTTTTASGGRAWVRNPDWLALPTVVSGDDMMYGLFAVYENAYNHVGISLSGSNPVGNIDWGDGTTSLSFNSTVKQEKVYSYAAVTGSVLVDDFGDNYKMVIIEVEILNNATAIYIDRSPTTGFGQNAAVNWLDVIIDCATMTVLSVRNDQVSSLLQRLQIIDNAITSLSFVYSTLPALRILQADFSSNTGAASYAFQQVGDIRQNDDSAVNINMPSATTATSAFTTSSATALGTVTLTAATDVSSIFTVCKDLVSIGTMDFSTASIMGSAFAYCYSLRTIGNITTTTALNGSCASMFRGCGQLRGVNISNMNNVTSLSAAFTDTGSLTSVILTGLTKTVDLQYNMMDADAIDALFTSLGTAVAQTISVDNNPGAATCDPTIATAKGWTVVV